MLNKPIPKEKLEKIKLVVFDSDGVSIPRGTEIEERVEHGDVEKIEIDMKTFVITDELAELLNKLRERFTVAISSGRSLLYLQTMYSPIIGDNTVLQAENGNISLIGGETVQHFEYDQIYFETLAAIRDDISELDIKGVEPKQFILSVHSATEFPEVYDIVKKHDQRSELRVMWNGEAFDIQRKDVSKAAGLAKLAERLEMSRNEIIAIGDRVNDKEMVNYAEIGVSADHQTLSGTEYWTEGEDMPAKSLAKHIVETLGL